MTVAADLQDRIAARLLGVDLDAGADVVRSRFRHLVRSVHPDTNVMDACVDLGRLAEAKDLLVRRAEERAEAAAREVAADERRRAEQTDRREAEARRRVEAMRAQPVDDGAEVLAHAGRNRTVTRAAAPRHAATRHARTASFTPLGVLVDVAC